MRLFHEHTPNVGGLFIAALFLRVTGLGDRDVRQRVWPFVGSEPWSVMPEQTDRLNPNLWSTLRLPHAGTDTGRTVFPARFGEIPQTPASVPDLVAAEFAIPALPVESSRLLGARGSGIQDYA